VYVKHGSSPVHFGDVEHVPSFGSHVYVKHMSSPVHFGDVEHVLSA
jgi:hypothetical protein